MYRVVSIDNARHQVTLINEKGNRLSFTFPDEHQTPEKKLAYIKRRVIAQERKHVAANILKSGLAVILSFVIYRLLRGI